MKLRTIILTLLVIVVTVFLGINWELINAPVENVNLLFTHMTLPLGTVVVAIFALVIFFLLGYIVLQQAGLSMEIRAASREARQARQLADEAEKSRLAEAKKELMTRMENLESLVATRTEESLVSLRDGVEANKALLEGLKADLLTLSREDHHAFKEGVEALKAEVKSRPMAVKAEKPETDDDNQKKEIFRDLI